MLTEAAKKELFASVDLRRLTGQPVPASRNKAVRVDCPVHGGASDLAIFPDHAFCFSAKCGWSGGAFDTAAILLGLYSKTDPMWPSKHFDTIIGKLKQLSQGFQAQEEAAPEPPTEDDMLALLTQYDIDSSDSIMVKIDRWRGWPLGTSMRHRLKLTKTAIAIPVYRSDGKLLTIRYRIRPKLEEKGKPKYWGTTGANEDNILYGGFTMPPNKGRAVALVEGEFDTISSQLAGVPTLSFINGAGWKEGREKVFAKLLDRYEKVLIAYDQDEGGQNGVHGYTTVRGNHVPGIVDMVTGVNIVTWDPKLGKDPNEFIRKQGPQAWTSLLKQTLRPTSRSSTASPTYRSYSTQTAEYA